jgi:flagellum-specific ATP synthase
MIDALARSMDGGPDLIVGDESLSVDNAPPSAMTRRLVKTAVKTGIRVIDIFTPLCSGQRIGIFSGSGVGKSTLLAMLSGATGFDTVIVVLVGERDARCASLPKQLWARKSIDLFPLWPQATKAP